MSKMVKDSNTGQKGFILRMMATGNKESSMVTNNKTF